MWLASRAGHSTTAIGRELGRDHTTIMHGIKAHEKREGAENGHEN
jgi:chromosomal replication initiation ATPase DnaA